MKSIAVFCSASEVDQKYVKHAEEFGRLMGKHGYNLVWGGSDKGLMHVIASAVQQEGGKLIGISIPRFQDVVHTNADEIIIAKTLGERKALMLERSDAIVALVGGIGTLDEITEIIELKKQQHHNKPIVILNTDHFYDGLKMQMQKMNDEGFIAVPIINLVSFATSPREAIEFIGQQT